MCANVRENMRCERVLFTCTVSYSGWRSVVNETNCNKKERSEQKKCERWRSNLLRKLLVLVVCVSVDLDGWALQLVLLIRGVSDFFIETAAL